MPTPAITDINREVLALWKARFGHQPSPPRWPLICPEPVKNGLVVVGCNPAMPKSNYYPVPCFRAAQVTDKIISELAAGEAKARIEYPYYAPFHSLAAELGLPLEHVDLFFYRETSQQKVRSMMANDGERLNDFGRKQVELAVMLMQFANPKIILVANAFAGRIFKKHFGMKYLDANGLYWVRFNGKQVPVCLNERFETYRYRGKTLLIGPDVRGDFLMERGAAMLKVLVGGDPISAEGKGSNGDFQMFGTFNVVVTCNSRLRMRLEGDTGAWRRRLLVVRYEKPPPAKRILDFDHVLLREEGSGILRWALAGFVKLQGEFAELGDFKLTDAQRQRVDSLLAESDSLRLFVKERLARHEYSDVTTSEIAQAYSEYCADKGWNAFPSAAVERMLPDLILESFHVTKSHDIERGSKKSVRGWHRVKLLAPEELAGEGGE